MNRHSLSHISMVIAIAACTMACSETIRPPRAQSADIQTVVDATELAAAFEASEERAAELYQGKTARIIGYFATAESLSDGSVAMTFKTSIGTFRPVRCILTAPGHDALSDVRSGDPISVRGTIRGFSVSPYSITVDGCSVD